MPPSDRCSFSCSENNDSDILWLGMLFVGECSPNTAWEIATIYLTRYFFFLSCRKRAESDEDWVKVEKEGG